MGYFDGEEGDMGINAVWLEFCLLLIQKNKIK
jgi:hypothetical protein